MNNKNLVDIKYVECRLQDWADWYSRGNYFNIGYPSCSVEYKLMKGAYRDSDHNTTPFNINSEAEEVESLINKMAKVKKKWALSIHCYYFSRGGLRRKALMMNISHQMLKKNLNCAKYWLSNHLVKKSSDNYVGYIDPTLINLCKIR